jgi:hypothetical protein
VVQSRRAAVNWGRAGSCQLLQSKP